MAFTAVAALVSGTAATATLVLAAMVEIGTVMTIVGAVTGNKDLMKLGGVISLVGGVGGLVAGAVGGAATAAGADAAVASAGAQQTVEIAAQGAEAVSSAVTQGSAVGQDLGILGNGITPTTGVNNPSAFTGQATQATANAANPIVATPGIQGPAAQIDVGDAVGRKIASSQTVATPGGAAKGGNFFSNTMDFIKNPANKELVNGGVKLLGGAFQGMNEADQFDQQMQFRKDQFNYEVGRNANVGKQNQSRSGILNRG